MKFNNVQNKMIEHDGETYWISRSVAVVGLVIASCNNDMYVLINQRGRGASDYHGYWNLPCGYLDWNESGVDAVIREIYEETGLNMKSYFNDNVLEQHQPFNVMSDAKENRQNVSLKYMFFIHVDKLPKLTNEHNEENETAEIGWFNVDEIMDKEFAFGHKEIILNADPMADPMEDF